jgi:hypothetical protein
MELVPTYFDLSPHAYLMIFVVGAAALAMWLHVRLPDAGPTSVATITVHMVTAVVGANLIVPAVLRSADSHIEVMAMTFGVVLPLVVYMFTAAIWLIRFGQAMLGRYSR